MASGLLSSGGFDTFQVEPSFSLQVAMCSCKNFALMDILVIS